MTITTMTVTMTNDLVLLGNNQPWLDEFLAEGWWVISTMMTTMRMTTMATTMAKNMRTILTRTYDDHNNNDNDNDNDKRTRFFRQQPTLVGCIPGRGVGEWVISMMMTTTRMMTMATTVVTTMRTFFDKNV